MILEQYYIHHGRPIAKAKDVIFNIVVMLDFLMWVQMRYPGFNIMEDCIPGEIAEQYARENSHILDWSE